jgi:uncharacterized protein
MQRLSLGQGGSFLRAAQRIDPHRRHYIAGRSAVSIRRGNVLFCYNRGVMKMAKKPARPANAFRILGKRYPGLVARIQHLIEDSEKAFAGNSPETEGSYLWEHTVHVASLAIKLAGEEKRDALLAALAALFHDAGKFAGGRYHDGDTPEEETAAARAETMLKKSRVAPADRAAVVDAIRALYREGRRSSPLADIVHDADFLSKFGYLGVAQFFIKSTLRGKTLRTAVMNSLSKELTYAACLALNMRTKAGRRWPPANRPIPWPCTPAC